MDDERLLTPEVAQLVESFRLENYNASREVERALRSTATREVTIKISAGKRDNDRPIRMLIPEALYRRVAATSVERYKQVERLAIILLLDADRVTEFF